MSYNNAKQALGQPMRMTTFKPKETLLFTALQSMLLTWGSANDIWEVHCIGSIPLISFNPGAQK